MTIATIHVHYGPPAYVSCAQLLRNEWGVMSLDDLQGHITHNND